MIRHHKTKVKSVNVQKVYYWKGQKGQAAEIWKTCEPGWPGRVSMVLLYVQEALCVLNWPSNQLLWIPTVWIGILASFWRWWIFSTPRPILNHSIYIALIWWFGGPRAFGVLCWAKHAKLTPMSFKVCRSQRGASDTSCNLISRMAYLPMPHQCSFSWWHDMQARVEGQGMWKNHGSWPVAESDRCHPAARCQYPQGLCSWQSALMIPAELHDLQSKTHQGWLGWPLGTYSWAAL